MRSAMLMVETFHRRHGFAVAAPLTVRDKVETQLLLRSADEVGGAADVLLDRLKRQATWDERDLRVARAQLILEEAAEVVTALANHDVVNLLDGLADLAYVVLGTAVAYGLPLPEAFAEVHRSNMTKDVGEDHKPAKGKRYVAPRIVEILQSRVR